MYELLVIGDDPAGLATASVAAERGLSVGLTCPSAHGLQSGPLLRATLRDLLPQLAVDVLRGKPGDLINASGLIALPDLRRLITRRAGEVADDRLAALRDAGVQIHPGRSRFLDAHRVEVTNEGAATILRAQSVAIATGASAASDLRIAGLEDLILGPDDALRIDRIPSRLVVIGTESPAIDFAGLFAVAGTRVTVVDGSVLPFADDTGETDSLFDVAMAMGVHFRTGTGVVGIDRAGNDAVVHLDNGDRLHARCVLSAGRRIGRTRTLNLDAAGLVTDDCYRLWCDHQYRTWQQHIFGVGEVVGFCPTELSPAGQANVVVTALAHPRRVPAPLGLGSMRSRTSARQ